MFRWLLAASLSFIPIAGKADNQTSLWAQAGEWQVRIDATLGSGCFMITSYQDGSILRVGLDPMHKISYLWLGNPKWQSLKVGQSYMVDVAFDSGAANTWKAGAIDIGGSTVLMLPFLNGDVWKLLSAASVLH
jgi:hypothetical protein